MTLIFLIIGMGIALWVFFDSQKHGYSVWAGLLWSIGVFFFLILFLPLYLVARRRKRMASSSTPPPSTELVSRSKCFYCGQEYGGAPKICPHCGQNLKI